MVAITSFLCGILLGVGYGWLFGLRMQSYVIDTDGHPSTSGRLWMIVSFILSYCLLFGAIGLIVAYTSVNLVLFLLGLGVGFGAMVWQKVRRLR